MNGSPKVIASLLKLKDLTNEIHDRLHDQEHLWEALEYRKLEKVFDKANRDVWDDLHHRFLRRAYDLGGRPEGVSDDVATAYSRALDGFNRIHEECQQLYELVEADRDYVTTKMLMKVQKEVEEWINYFEAKLAQVRALKDEDGSDRSFMAEQL